MRKFLIGAALIVACQNAQAVTLNEALTSGYKHDEEHKNIRTDFLTEIEQFPAALAEFMPRIRAVVQNQRTKINRKSPLPTNISDSVTRRSDQLSKSVILEQNLFSGGAHVAGLKAAQSAFRASRANFYNGEQEILLREISTYLDTVEAQEKYKISKISVRSNRTQLEAMTEKFKLGESTETEVARAEASLAAAEANQAQAYSDFERTKANFRRVFGVEPVGINMPPVPNPLPKTLAEFTSRSLKVNPRIQAARNVTAASKSREYAAKAALLPSVNLSLQEGRDYFNPPNLDNNSDINRRSFTTTVSVNIPILQRGGAEYSDIRRAKYQTRKGVIQLDNEIKVAKANCQATWENFLSAKERIKAAAKGVRAAEVAYDGTLQEEMLGSKTIVDVLDTEERLNQARQTKVEAEKGLVLAGFQIKQLIGEITAKSMALPVEYFEPEREFKKAKLKIVSF